MTEHELDSNTYTTKIQSIGTQFSHALEDFKKYFVYFHKNPELSEFQNYYENSKSQLMNLNKELVDVTLSIQQDIGVLDASMSKIGGELEQEQTLNKNLNDILHGLINTQNGSSILINDSKYEYDRQYMYNLELLIGMCIVGSGFLLFRKRENTFD